MDTPTRLLIEEMLKLDFADEIYTKPKTRLKEEVKMGDERPKVNRYFMIETQPQDNHTKVASKDDETKLNERLLATEAGSATMKAVSADMLLNFGDGKRIYVNRLRFYKESAMEEHMISFK